MRRVCAWCNTPMSDDARAETSGEPITHGICDACAAVFGNPYRRALRDFLDSVAEPILVVDVAGVVITANACARAALGKDLADMEGFPGGDVFECVNARLPGGCGRTVHCASCQVRSSVTYTVETGCPLCKVEAYLDVATPRGFQRRRLLISTEKVGVTVLVRLDAMQPALAGEFAPLGSGSSSAVP